MDLLSGLFTIIATIVLPIGAGIWLSVKKKGYLKPILLGAITFVVVQILTRIPLLQLVLPHMLWYTIFSTTQPVLYALFLGATAALFEEGGRWLVMRLFMKNRLRLNDGLAFGVGHGGIEAVLLVGISAVALLISNFSSTTSLLSFASGFERICTIVLHMAWSVMVLKSVALKKPVWLLIAFMTHTAIDMAAVLMAGAGTSLLVMEAVVCVCALILLGYIIVEYKKYKGAEIQ